MLGAGDPEGGPGDSGDPAAGATGRGLPKEDSAGMDVGVSAGGVDPCVAHIDAERCRVCREKGLHASINPEMR